MLLLFTEWGYKLLIGKSQGGVLKPFFSEGNTFSVWEAGIAPVPAAMVRGVFGTGASFRVGWRTMGGS